MIFEYAGYEVTLAASGPVGLKLAEQEPRLVFLDIKMPQMDGLEVLKQLRSGTARPRRDPLRARHGQGRRRGGEAGRLRLHREAPDSERILIAAGTPSGRGAS